MPTMDLNNLFNSPSFIKERLYMDEHANALIELEKKFNLTNEKSRAILLIQKDILLKNQKINDDLSIKIAVELLGNYFLLFQDFLGKVDNLILQNGGDLKMYQDRARKLLSPHRQLQEFIKPYIYDFGLENSGDAARDELIDIILDRALGKVDEKGLIDRLRALFEKIKIETKAEEVADTIENLLVAGDISKKWAEYYANLAENVLSGQPFVEEEEKKEETKEESVILEKSEEQPRKELSAAEIQEKIKIAKELLDTLNIYGMKKTQIYDTIKQAENLAEHLGKSQNMLEKRAVEDELRGMIDKIVSDIKEASAAPAGVDEIQNALRDLS